MFKKYISILLLVFPASLLANVKNASFIADVTPKGAKITAVALEYEDNILSGSDLRQLYQVETSLNQEIHQNRTLLKAYVNNAPKISYQSQNGKYVILELDDRDNNADFYSLKTENSQPIEFKAKNAKGEIIATKKVQSNKVPQFYQDKLSYLIKQTGNLKLTNGKTLPPSDINLPAKREHITINYIDEFSTGEVSLLNAENKLLFRFYKPQIVKDKKYPLTLFLHGSGQVGKDNLAHLLSSKGAISTLQYEDGFVVAPQYSSIFDAFDKTGIHWQTANRHQLILKMLDELITQYPNIDTQRIYIVGLSRGAEGGLYLLQKRPEFFAGALLMSGREANTVEWIDGNATVESLVMLKDKPIWFFHSQEDKISPVKGSQINYQILKEKLHSQAVKYTEFEMKNVGDNGIVNNNPHNSWDAVFNSPEAMQWLLQQRLSR